MSNAGKLQYAGLLLLVAGLLTFIAVVASRTLKRRHAGAAPARLTSKSRSATEKRRFEGRLAGRHIPVHVAAHSVEPAGVRCLPDGPRPGTEAGFRADAPKPERPVEGRADPVAFVEPPGEIKNGALIVTRFHDPQEVAEFLVDLGPRRAAAAVAREFEVYGWRQRCRVERHGTNEIRRLCPPAAAEPEKMIGASADARPIGGVPVGREPPVDVI